MAIINGTGGRDTLNGTTSADWISGRDGDDTIIGGRGTDTLTGGAGADVFVFAYGDGGGFPHDVITDFQVGIDRLQFPTGGVLHTEGDTAGQWVHYGTNLGNNDWVQLQGVHGATLAQLTGTSGTMPTDPPPPPPPPPTMGPTTGNDTLTGTESADTIDARAGNDVVDGRGGDDTIIGGPGTDTLTGGAGADVFVFAYGDGGGFPHDVITDFQVGIDRLQFPTGAVLHTEGDTAGQWVHYGTNLGNNDWVQLQGVHGATLAQLTGASGTTPTDPPPPPPPPATGGWVESFDNGAGLLSRYWGNVDFSVRGQVTLTSYASNGWSTDSGIMVPPTGASSGYGYGTYSFTLNTHGRATGDYALLWPASDVWPGPELDVVELDLSSGTPYSAIHWRGADGGDRYNVYPLDKFNFDPWGVHTYSMQWAPDHITVSVDGIEQYTTRENVPRSYADGGQNSAPSVGMQTGWATSAQNGNNTLTVYEVSYTPLIA